MNKINSIMALREEIITNYSYDRWFFKNKILKYVIENYPKIRTELNFKQPGGLDNSDPNKMNYKPIEDEIILDSLRIESYMNTLQMVEAFFGWIYTFRENQNAASLLLPVERLAYYEGRELSALAKQISQGTWLTKEQIGKFVYGLNEQNSAQIKQKNPAAHGSLIENAKKLELFLKKLAQFYLDNLDLYNSFKHGNRIIRAKLTATTTMDDPIAGSVRDTFLVAKGCKYFYAKRKEKELIYKWRSLNFDQEREIFDIVYKTIRNVVEMQKYLLNQFSLGKNKHMFVSIADKEIDTIFKNPDHTLELGAYKL